MTKKKPKEKPAPPTKIDMSDEAIKKFAEDRSLDLFLRDLESGVSALSWEELKNLKPTSETKDPDKGG